MTRRAPPLDEESALEILRRHLGWAQGGPGRRSGPKVASERQKAADGVRLGLGDDAAILAGPGSELCWTVDSCEEGIHFELGWLTPNDLAHKSLQAALSDVAAMGAKPLGMLCHVTLTPSVDRSYLDRFVRTQAEIAARTGCPLIGGNLSFGARLAVVTTVLGTRATSRQAAPLLTRRGAKPGDEVWLVGNVGWARLGLELLRRGKSKKRRGAALAALAAFRRPLALLSEGRGLLGRASACLDVSDGLARDTRTLADASGVRLIVSGTELHAQLGGGFLSLCRELDLEPLETALSGGEDYALLATGPKKKRPPFAVTLGNVEAGRGAFLELEGKRTPLVGGFVHRQM